MAQEILKWDMPTLETYSNTVKDYFGRNTALKPNIFKGTTAEWEALSTDQKAQYEVVVKTDDDVVPMASQWIVYNDYTLNDKFEVSSIIVEKREGFVHIKGNLTCVTAPEANTSVTLLSNLPLEAHSAYALCTMEANNAIIPMAYQVNSTTSSLSVDARYTPITVGAILNFDLICTAEV